MLPAWVAEMDFPLAPAITTALEEAVRRGDAGYASPQSAGLTEAFCEFSSRRSGWEIDSAGVIPVADVMGGVSELLRILTSPGDGVVINPPVYFPFFSVPRDIGRRVVEAPLGPDSALDVEAIERQLAAGACVVLLCNPHNPTGSVPRRDELIALADAAERHDAWVISDEIHAPLTLAGAEHTTFITVSATAAARGISVVSASKTFNIAGLKCALVVTADGPAREQAECLPQVARHPGHLGTLASVAAYSDGGAWLDEVLAVLDANRTLLGELLGERLPEVVYEPPRAGYLTWLDCRGLELGADPAEVFLLRGKVALSDGPQFGTQGESFARLNIGTTPALVREAVDRMARAIGR